MPEMGCLFLGNIVLSQPHQAQDCTGKLLKAYHAGAHGLQSVKGVQAAKRAD